MSASLASAGREHLRALLMRALEAKLVSILAHARPTGQFGTEPWIVRDQDAILTLTLLYQCPDGPHYRDPRLLELIAAGGRYLRSRQDAKGMFPFDKKDGSNWGPIYMPWTYLRWMITYDLVATDLSEFDRAVWSEGLQLGYAGIAATELSSLSNIYPGPLPGQPPLQPGEIVPWIHNIPCHHAAGLFLAGLVFGLPAWRELARDYMQHVVAAQSEQGWWTEHVGPVVLYNRVYLEALGIYHALSGDESVRPALERGNTFHLNYVYPNGAMIETIDERNPYPPLKVVTEADGTTRYLPGQVNIHPGLYYTDSGRALLAHQLPHLLGRDPAEIEAAEFLYLFLPEANAEFTPASAPARRFHLGHDALVAREEPWLVSLSAFCCPRTPNRFIQDRQNFLSIYHRDAGLIVGGGNTKLQPRWSTLTVGDPDALSPVGASRTTDLAPEVSVAYVPERGVIAETAFNQWTLRLTTAGATIEWTISVLTPSHLRLGLRLLQPPPDGRPVTSHLTFIPCLGQAVRFSDGTGQRLTAKAWSRVGLTSLTHQRWQLTLPLAARVTWPVLPHNPYTANGHAELNEARLVVAVPLGVPDPPKIFDLTIRS